MAFNCQSAYEDGVYLIPKHKIDKTIQIVELESTEVVKETNCGYKVYDDPNSTFSSPENIHCNEWEEVWTTIGEDNNSISDTSGLKTDKEDRRGRRVRRRPLLRLTAHDGITRSARGVKDVSNEEKRAAVPTRNTCIVTSKNMSIFGFLILLVIIGWI
jgi:hypothetical protein